MIITDGDNKWNVNLARLSLFLLVPVDDLSKWILFEDHHSSS